jgi:glycolate oxidase FAD binding subunit
MIRGMAVGAAGVETPSSEREVADLLKACADEGRSVRVRGGATKLGWGNPVDADVELRTGGLDSISEFNPGDMTALLQPGVRLADAQASFADEGLRLSLDPPLGAGDAATIGGVLATADSGPLRHRYGAIRDLVIGVRIALPDGTVAKAGGRVIKNVAGYDLGKLNAGAYGTLGVLVEVAVRLHPLPQAEASATATFADPSALAGAVRRIAHSPLETEALDYAWRDGHGGLVARYGGAAAADQAKAAAGMLALEPGGEAGVVDDDEGVWAQQRAFQRASLGGPAAGPSAPSAAETIVRVSALPADLADVVRAADEIGASAAGRAAVGVSWLRIAGADAAAVERLRERLSPSPCVVLDAPDELRSGLDPWGEAEGPLLTLSRRLKERFDPTNVCNPGIFVGGI